MGGAMSGSTVQDYDIKGVAQETAKKIRDADRFTGAVFYDPVVEEKWHYNEDKEFAKVRDRFFKLSLRQHNNPEKMSQKDAQEMYYLELQVKKHRDDELAAYRQQSFPLLRDQVNDFIAWLKKEGIVKE
jgi:hypothetical protein